MSEAWILEAVRSPIGRYRGVLKDVRPDDLLGQVLAALVDRAGRSGLPADAIGDHLSDVIVGCANQAGEDNRNVARMGLLLAGLPQSIPGVTVNRLCGSGLEAVLMAARAIRADEGDLYIAGGVESMTRAPLVMGKPDTAFPNGNVTVYDSSLGWRFQNPRMAQLFPLESMGDTAENLADRYQIGREEQDLFALGSHQRAVAAQAQGRFADEIVPIVLSGGKGKNDRGQPPQSATIDEGPRADTTLERLEKLPPVFRAKDRGGTVTAGNSSPLNDGAAALLLASPERARKLGLRPIARVVAGAAAGVDPRYMGIGPVPATHKVLERAGWALRDIDLCELNEAFAVQSLAVLKELPDLAADRVNVHGGAIALGHPLGCSGARLVTTLIHELRRSGRQRGLCTLCIGVGQGVAGLFERVVG